MEPLRGSRNVYGNAFVRRETDLLRESQAQRDGDASKARIWKIKNLNRTNAVTGNLARTTGKMKASHNLLIRTALLS